MEYKNSGFKTREEYLDNLAAEYGISEYEVESIADVLGESEDFDGLLSELDEYSDLINN